jgi:hypothetical protein
MPVVTSFAGGVIRYVKLGPKCVKERSRRGAEIRMHARQRLVWRFQVKRMRLSCSLWGQRSVEFVGK